MAEKLDNTLFNRILVALDCEEGYRPVFEKALSLAQATGAQLVLMGVLSPDGDNALPALAYPGVASYPLVIDEDTWKVYQEGYRAYQLRGMRVLRKLLAEAKAAGIDTEIIQKTGNPGKLICQQAETILADLIIVGSHGRIGLSEMLLGSVSNYVTHHADCSVLVVHGSGEANGENISVAELAMAEG